MESGFSDDESLLNIILEVVCEKAKFPVIVSIQEIFDLTKGSFLPID